MWNASVITLYPEFFPGILSQSLSGKAMSANIWSLKTYNIRHHGIGKHKKVDDIPFGGGAGLVMRADVVDNAINEALEDNASKNLVFLTPTGKQLNQKMVKDFSSQDGITILCGHFEGIDSRIVEKYNPTCISIGDYILSGGEIASMVLIDACVRMLDGVINSNSSLVEESFENDLLEYPQYTRPRTWENITVPDVLISGDHKKISSWRKNKSEEITQKVRPDLYNAYSKNQQN